MIDAILVGKWLKSPDEPLRWLKSRLLFLRFRGISAPVRVRQIVSRFAIPKIPNLSASPMNSWFGFMSVTSADGRFFLK
jgi:hypothetical protein